MVWQKGTERDLYMSLWGSDELFVAAIALGRDALLTRAVVDDRIFKFGGVARQEMRVLWRND